MQQEQAPTIDAGIRSRVTILYLAHSDAAVDRPVQRVLRDCVSRGDPSGTFPDTVEQEIGGETS